MVGNGLKSAVRQSPTPSKAQRLISGLAIQVFRWFGESARSRRDRVCSFYRVLLEYLGALAIAQLHSSKWRAFRGPLEQGVMGVFAGRDAEQESLLELAAFYTGC